MIADEICNAVRSENAGLTVDGIPIDVFPQKVQTIILNLHTYANYDIEYTMAAFLSATATAIGNSYGVKVKEQWYVCPSLYIVLVGRPGAGKSHPVTFAYTPLFEKDAQMQQQFLKDLRQYEMDRSNKKGKGTTLDLDRPQLVKTVLSDFTPEALAVTHSHNLRGVCINCDEVVSIFRMANRYGSSNTLIQMLLEAFSGIRWSNTRLNLAIPANVSLPCVNIIGTTQVGVMSEICKAEYMQNGFVDRFMFVHPKNQKVPLWDKNQPQCPTDLKAAWASVLNQILTLECNIDGNLVCPCYINMSDEARDYFFDWHNKNAQELNEREVVEEDETRKGKLDIKAIRLALVIQIMKWACGEDNKEGVGLDAVKAGIKLTEYFEQCYIQIQEASAEYGNCDVWTAFQEQLPDEFQTSNAVQLGKTLGLSERTVKSALQRWNRDPSHFIKKERHGSYKKCKPQ